MDEVEAALREKYAWLRPSMNEATARLWAGAEAKALGRGGVAAVVRATGLSRTTVMGGMRDLDDAEQLERIANGQLRRAGAGRKSLTETQPGLLDALEKLVSPATRGDPESPLRWSAKSLRTLAEALNEQGFSIGHDSIAALLAAQGYSLQAPRKMLEGGDHPDRDEQFEYIAKTTQAMQAAEQPVISVDCKKKELVGEFKNGGREWQPEGQPTPVSVYDFPSDALFKAIPYGVYDVTRNEGWVSVGITHDTAEFAVNTIREWWNRMGKSRYPEATELYITADGGGSNGSRNRLWKQELQAFADRSGLTIHVSHFPPGTSKWNKIEHRLFSFISMNWRGRPLSTLETVVSLIGNVTTRTGLKVRAIADDREYLTGRRVTKEDMRRLALEKDAFHGEWNYSIKPRQKSSAD